MQIAVIGTGYVGLISGVCLADVGHDVICVDVDEAKVQAINACKPPIYEEGLEEKLQRVRKSGKFQAMTNLETALKSAEVALVAVGTPTVGDQIDLTYVKNVANQIGQYLKTSDSHISIVVKSTVIPGTTDSVVLTEIERASGKVLGDFGLGMNPEFLREGNAIFDFDNPDRIVLGAEDKITMERLVSLYEPWDVTKIKVNTRTAEMIKYANNAILATQISAMNEIANLSAAIGGIDSLDVLNGITSDKRWSPIVDGKRVIPEITTYLRPGCGFGGSCFPKDVQALASAGKQVGLDMSMLNSVMLINGNQPSQVAQSLRRNLGSLTGVRILILGLAFKPGTDDVRESASATMIGDFIKDGASVVAHDPVATPNFDKHFGEFAGLVSYAQSWEAEIGAAKVIVVATSWEEYKSVPSLLRSDQIIFDARRIFNKNEVNGATYLGIGISELGPQVGV